MRTRSEKYLEEDISNKPKVRASRSDKNKYLYDAVDKGIRYEAIDGFDNYKTDLGDEKKERNRDNYMENRTNDKQNEEDADKVFDINSVLEEAKRSREIPTEIENKRNLQNVEYNILSDLNKKYISKKEKEELEKEEIKELIDTITSRNLPKEIMERVNEEDDSKDLMSDLMATNTMTALDKVDLEEEIAKEILADQQTENDDEDEIKKEDGRLVNSFYTRSMDLTEHDFSMKDEFDEDKPHNKLLIVLTILILIAVAAATFFILNYFGIFKIEG